MTLFVLELGAFDRLFEGSIVEQGGSVLVGCSYRKPLKFFKYIESDLHLP